MTKNSTNPLWTVDNYPFDIFHNSFEDFRNLFDLAELNKYIITFWYHPDNLPDGQEVRMYAKIIGCTKFKDDYILHLIPFYEMEDNSDDSYLKLSNKNGIDFILLSELIHRHGFSIQPFQNGMIFNANE